MVELRIKPGVVFQHKTRKPVKTGYLCDNCQAEGALIYQVPGSMYKFQRRTYQEPAYYGCFCDKCKPRNAY